MPTKTVAYQRLGLITKKEFLKDAEAKLRSVPEITPVLTEIMSGLLDRGLPADPYYYLNSAKDIDAQLLMKVYRSIIPSARVMLPLEAFCIVSGVDPNVILDSIVNSIQRLNALKAGVSLSASQPEMVETTILAAKDIENGHKDRRLHMQVSGLMPMAKGAKTIVNVHSSANASASPTMQALVIPAPAPEQTVRRLSERLHSIKESLPPTNQKVEEAVLVEDEE